MAEERVQLRRRGYAPFNTARDREICAAYRDGATITDLARDYALTRTRIHQILREAANDDSQRDGAE